MFNPNYFIQGNGHSKHPKDLFLHHSRQPQRVYSTPMGTQPPLLPSLSRNFLPPLNFPKAMSSSQQLPSQKLPQFNNHKGYYVPKLTSPQEYINQKTKEYISKHPESMIINDNEKKNQSLDLKKTIFNAELPLQENVVKKPHQHLSTDKTGPIECPICHKKFNRLSSYTNHKNLHTGERPYSCKVCGKSFNASPNLSRHKKIHMRK